MRLNKCCGGLIPRVYKLKNGKLSVNIPFEVISVLGLKDGDDVDFFMHPEKYFIFAKKSDIVPMLLKNGQQPKPTEETLAPPTGVMVDAEELGLLKKLDEFRYPDRTRDKVNAKLNDKETQVLQGLMKKKIVALFKKPNEQEYRYSISNDVYTKFLFRMRGLAPDKELEMLKWQKEEPVRQPLKESGPKEWEKKIGGVDTNMGLLETNGFIVLQTEAEASALSIALEDSIRRGLVIGTRAFNKKFYVALKGFIEKSASKIIKAIGHKSMSVSDLSKITGVPEDGIRSVLYILLESGDITEVRKDVFRMIE
jgi:bifunctional DNA-binding transcriptional regulator/antitoxin component of YhaV-PrlF toxin-antitoxin module